MKQTLRLSSWEIQTHVVKVLMDQDSISPQDTVHSDITVTPTKKVKRARAQFPSKHCAMMYLMRIRTLMKSMSSPLKHAHLPTSPQDVNKHYARTPFKSIQKHCSTFDPWDLPPGSAPLLWAPEVQRTKRTPGDKAHHCQQFSPVQSLATVSQLTAVANSRTSGQERHGKL